MVNSLHHTSKCEVKYQAPKQSVLSYKMVMQPIYIVADVKKTCSKIQNPIHDYVGR
jgi:hypothetical protein